MQRHVYRVAPASLAGAFLSTFSSCACAGLTEIITNPFGEPGPGEIISHVYDDAVSPSGDNFVGAVVTATQLDDGTASQLLTSKKFAATAVAKFSGNTQSYGLLDHGTFIPVFSVVGEDFNVTGSGTIKVNSGQSFARSGNSGTDSSIASQNADDRDHVVTYRISGANPDPQFLQFWEDLTQVSGQPKRRSSSDFNDLVVQLSAPTGGSGGSSGSGSGSGGGGGSGGAGVTVPLPSAAWGGAALAAGIAIVRRVKRALPLA